MDVSRDDSEAAALEQLKELLCAQVNSSDSLTKGSLQTYGRAFALLQRACQTRARQNQPRRLNASAGAPVARLCITLIPFPAQLGAARLQTPTPPPDHAAAFELALFRLADDLDVSPRRVRSGVKTFIEAITQQCIPLSIMREHFARVEGTGSGSQA